MLQGGSRRGDRVNAGDEWKWEEEATAANDGGSLGCHRFDRKADQAWARHAVYGGPVLNVSKVE